MRINLYHHEMRFMAERQEAIEKVADTGIKFHGLRLYTEAPLMHQPGDRLWVRETFRGPASWGANPWVWVIGFKRIDASEGERG